MSNQDQHMETIVHRLEAENARLQKRLRITCIVFAILAVIVLGYCSFVYKHIQELVGPETLKERGEAAVNTLAEQPDRFIRKYDEEKDEWASALVAGSLDSIPRVTELTKNRIDMEVDKVCHEVENKLFPEIAAFLRDSAPELRAKFKDAKAKDADLTVGDRKSTRLNSSHYS